MATRKMKKRKRKKKVPLTPQRKHQIKFHKAILEMFKRMGFEYIRTEGKKVRFDGRESEIDSVFLFKNIILICEETIGKTNATDHLRNKYEFFEKLSTDRENFLSWIKNIGKDKFARFDNYSNARYKIFYIYFTEQPIEEEKRILYGEFKYIDYRILKYFLKVADSIRYSARNEFYKFIGVDFRQIGNTKGSYPEHIYSAVIFPEDVSGMPSGVSLVSFVMTAKELLDCAYVFRKENWDQNTGYYYQRLIERSKIVSIREFLSREKRTFIDNIIVSLPKEAKFYLKGEKDLESEPIDPKAIDDVTSNIEIKIPYKSNSIGIIDGQHRVFGHYEGPDDQEERIIADLRNKRHLFITGLYYQKGMFTESEKRKFESQLFLEINSKQKKVNTQILQHIQSLQDPFSPIGISTSVIQKMNTRSPFLNLFLLSELDNKGIKTPTIIKYGLQQLVEIDESKETLFKYWHNQDKNLLQKQEGKDNIAEELLNKYVSFCADTICKFFISVQSNFKDDWVTDGTSKLLTVTSIVAFIKSFGMSLEVYQGVKEIGFYQKKLSALKIDFKNKEKFPYVSSQWPKFAAEINKCWTIA
ncbi:MAG: DGQHR domain-containing protein [Nitrospirae bacterium]|nr:DGQHR domain-containing protein [Nitrospirota bacterium]